ncbi:hypothetical protein [Stenotrophomonas indicatrix]|uniref:hypothetical protein n=1 Tax=Stenotrophomonas indicatrix TaxID=2045451 RepID=UPI0028A801B0|nr:hypothetical protein [Stenotrophomonas indicatrix]
MIEIREFRRMLDAGRRYLEGTCSIHELYGCAVDLETAAKFWEGHRAIAQVAREWSCMADRRWNECRHHPDPLSEYEFLSWLQQLGAFGVMR